MPRQLSVQEKECVGRVYEFAKANVADSKHTSPEVWLHTLASNLLMDLNNVVVARLEGMGMIREFDNIPGKPGVRLAPRREFVREVFGKAAEFFLAKDNDSRARLAVVVAIVDLYQQHDEAAFANRLVDNVLKAAGADDDVSVISVFQNHLTEMIEFVLGFGG